METCAICGDDTAFRNINLAEWGTTEDGAGAICPRCVRRPKPMSAAKAARIARLEKETLQRFQRHMESRASSMTDHELQVASQTVDQLLSELPDLSEITKGLGPWDLIDPAPVGLG